MTNASAAAAFVAKWQHVTINEKATAQEHFIDLCRLFNHPTPVEADPAGTWYRFEKPLTKTGGQAGFADVWKRDFFAWEYKTKGKYPDLTRAYQQLLLYKEALDNPPILAACDIGRYEIHIAFTGHKTRIETFTHQDLTTVSTRDLLRLVFTDPTQLRPAEKITTITEKIAEDFARVAQFVENRGYEPQRVAHFFMKLLFGMFAEDIGLLPGNLLSGSIKAAIRAPGEFPGRVQALFRTMRDGGYFGVDKIPHFNGGLFDDDDVIPLTADDLMFLNRAATQDWRDVEPAIFGTLFERSLDFRKRAKLGAHYTHRSDIERLVRPTLTMPLRRAWEAAQATIEGLRPQWEQATGNAKRHLQHQIEGHVFDFLDQLGATTVCDPASGSGNFLYVALHELKDLEKEVLQYAAGIGLPEPNRVVGPHQLYGLEINPFAAELARVVVWIGDLQWDRQNGFWSVQEPILKDLNTIQCADALMTITADGVAVEPFWPAATVLVGNPPFLGDKRMRTELGHDYVEQLRALYHGRVPGGADLVTYWFERARAAIEQGTSKRAGFIATQAIRAGANRRVLDRIKQTGDIFYAHADRPWVLDGAAVRVSLIGFDNGTIAERQLDDRAVGSISSNLMADIDLTRAARLRENIGIAFIGGMKKGAFDIPSSLAQQMLQAPANPNDRPNSDVIFPWINGLDVTDRPRNMWIIDFGVDTSEAVAKQFEVPYAYVREHVKPARDQVRATQERTKWWLHARPAPDLRAAVASLRRYIVTPRVAKHRLFVFVANDVIADGRLCVIAREDDYTLGVLHSRIHEVWSLATSSRHGDGDAGGRPTYNATTCFETFPFPWSPGQERLDDSLVVTIADAARALLALRTEWLHPPSLVPAQMKDRTLTNLYNKRPDWLVAAHERLDQAVSAAYGWDQSLSDADILAQLLALNLERADGQGDVVATTDAVEDEAE